MRDFAQRMKALRAEVEALKTAKRKSSTTLSTISKTATCNCTLFKDNYGMIYTRYAGTVKLIPKYGQTLLYSVANQPYASRNRDVRIFNWLFDDGSVGAVIIPFSSSADVSMANNSTKNIALTVTITATGDFQTESGQILNDDWGL